jgi:ABC-type oligopeptide transport system substrate-binding subunit
MGGFFDAKMKGCFNMKKSLIIAGVVAMGAGAFSTQAIPTQAAKQRTLNVAVSTEPSSLDPAHSVDNVSENMMEQIMTGLYTRDGNGKVVPAMATKVVKPTNGGLTYTIPLRHDNYFSNGDNVTAQDFVYSIKRIVDPKTKTEFAYKFENIKNYQAILDGKMSSDQLGISAPSKYTLKIELSQPVPYYNSQLTEYYPTSEKAVKKYGDKFGTTAQTTVSNGAYRLKNYDGTGDSWDYVKDPHYFAAKSVKINKVHVRVVKDASTANNLFTAGKLDDAPISGSMIVKNLNNKALVKTPAANMNYLQFNTKKKALNNVDLRRAVSYALDRKNLTKRVLQDGAQPAKAFSPNGLVTDPKTGKDFTSEVTEKITYSPKKAKAYLKKALKAIGKKQISFTLLTADNEVDKQVGDYVQGQLTKVLPQLNVKVTSVPKQTRIQRSLDGDFDAVLMSWNSNIQDASDYLDTATATNISNFSRFKDAKYTALMKTVDTTTNQTPAQRLKDEQAANARVVNVAGYIPVFQSANDRLINTKVGGLHYTLFADAHYKDAYFK